MSSNIDTEREHEQHNEDLGYLKRKAVVELHLKDVFDETQSPVMRLGAISNILLYTKSYEDRFEQVLTDVRAAVPLK